MAERPICVLLVEDNPGDARLIREALADAAGGDALGAAFELVCVERLADGLARVQDESIDVVLLDLSLPDSQGFETFEAMCKRAPDRPIVVLSGLDDQALAARAVREGAQDYLVKGVDGDVLVRSLRYAVERKRAEDDRAELIREQAARAEAESRARRSTFLAEASTLLAESLDYETTLASVARLAVPLLADWCIVDMAEEGTIRRLAVAHATATNEQLALQLRRHPPDPDGPNPILEVLRTGQTTILPELTEAVMKAIAGDAEHFQFIRELGFRSAVIVPLAARGRMLGTIMLVTVESGRRRAIDVSLAEDLAFRCALAVDNARLYRLAQEATRTREAERDRLRQVLDVFPEGVLITDAAGHVVMSNAAADALWKRPSPEARRASDFGIFRLDGSVCPAEELPLARSLHGGEVVRGQQLLIQHATTGARVPVLVSSAPVRDDTGAIVGGVAVFQDISAIKELERQKDEFLSAASHDLKTPLATIKGHSQLLRRLLLRSGADKLDEARLLDSLQRIDRTVSRLTKMVNDLLDITRIQMDRPLDLDPQPTDLAALARRVAGECQLTTNRHRIRVESASPTLEGVWDAARLERVLANLLGNAIKYTPAGGEIEVVLGRERVDGIGDWARIEVRDSGVGIPDDEVDRVFERFYRGSNVAGRTAGTGIGLTGTRQIVEQHGGEISVTSREGEGTTFVVRLPLRVASSE